MPTSDPVSQSTETVDLCMNQQNPTAAEKSQQAAQQPPETVEDRLDRAHAALHRIQQWCEAYPVDIFPEPVDLTAIRAKIGDSEMSRLHASWARHLLGGIAGYAKGGL